MSSPLDSCFGFAAQEAKGTVNSTDAEFAYVLFENETFSPNEIVRPIPREAGADYSLGAGVVKTGVSTGGAVSTIPRPDAIGWLLLGLMGAAAAPTGAGPYGHVFTFDTSEFDLPYFTIRRDVASLWGEAFADCRVTGLTLSVPAVDMVRAEWRFLGRGVPQVVSTAAWSPATYLDDGEQFLTCLATLTSPNAGTFLASNIVIAFDNVIALNEEWVVGSYSPNDLTLGGRTCTITCDIRADADLFKKMQYVSAGGAAPLTWDASILSDGAFALKVETTDSPAYSLLFEMDDANDNVDWTVAPVGVVAANNLQTMRVSGTLKHSAGTQAQWTLINNHSAEYAIPTP